MQHIYSAKDSYVKFIKNSHKSLRKTANRKMGKTLEQTFTEKRDVQMANTFMKRCSASSVMGKA